MDYIPSTERRERLADAATRLLAYPDFRTFCSALMSDVVDKNEEILALEGTATSRAQGGIQELRRVLDAVFGAPALAEKLAMMTSGKLTRGADGYIYATSRLSDQA